MTAPADIVGAFARGRIVVLGDVMLDRFVDGQVRRISPEAPIPVFSAGRESLMLGGAGNVARNVTALGGCATLIGVVGIDPAGQDLHGLAAAEPRLRFLPVEDPDRPTTTKTRFVAGGQHVLRVDGEDARPVSGALAEALLDRLGEALAEADLLVLSDYAKGVLTPATLARAIAAARARGVPVVADPKSSDLSRYAGVDVLTPNGAEAALATGQSCEDDAGAAAAAERVAELAPCSAVVLTRGARGLTAFDRGPPATVLHLPAQAREVFDLSGAGDTVVAALSLGLVAGAPLAGAAELANLAAGVAVGRVGTVAVSADDLRAALDRAADESGPRKVVDLGTALARVEAWRRQGRRVVLTNGCFDLIHPGHLHLLGQARRCGDRLVVAINTDASVRRLKGADRPVQTEGARAEILASLKVVDLVLTFSDDTPLALIQALRPDVLVKGADYAMDQVVGADVVRRHGGTVVLADLKRGHSTSSAIRRIAEASRPAE